MYRFLSKIKRLHGLGSPGAHPAAGRSAASLRADHAGGLPQPGAMGKGDRGLQHPQLKREGEVKALLVLCKTSSSQQGCL